MPTERLNSVGRVAALCTMACMVLACATPPPGQPGDDVSATPWARESASAPAAPWQHQQFPGKQASSYRYERHGGREAMLVDAQSSASMLRQVLRVEAADLGELRFSWQVPALIAAADLRERDLDDSPVRIVLAFEGDRAKFSARDAMLSELAHALTGEPMPYATLMYVWCNHSPPGTVLHNTRTSRIRKLVLESGASKLHQWLDYQRDIRADFEKAFGEAPGALVSIGIMTDTDNTRSHSTAWYGPLRHVRLP